MDTAVNEVMRVVDPDDVVRLRGWQSHQDPSLGEPFGTLFANPHPTRSVFLPVLRR